MFGQAIIKAFRKAVTLAVQLVRDAAVSIEGKDAEDKKALLRKCASTTLNSKLARPSLIPRGAIFLCKALYIPPPPSDPLPVGGGIQSAHALTCICDGFL